MATTLPSPHRIDACRTLILGALVSAVLSGLFATSAHGEAGLNGRTLYREYCASCHGITGKGDGPDASIFTAPPRNLREGFLRQYKTEDLVRRVREGRPLELALDLPALRARATEVEAVAGYLKRLPTVDWPLAQSGQELYLERCAICHGPTGRHGPARPPGVRLPRDLSDPALQASLSDGELITLVRHGRKGMPALTPRLSEAAGRPLAAFVRLFSPGYEIYSRYCASCHGNDGRGPAELAESIKRPTVVFDRSYFSRRDPEQLRTAIWHMIAEEKPAMPHYRTLLDAAQARAIIEYLKRTH